MQNLPLTLPQTLTKSEAEELFKGVVSSVKSGDLNALTAEAFFVYIEHAIKSAREQIKSESESEVKKAGKQGDTINGVQFTLQGRNGYQYSECPAYQDAEKKLKAIESMIKAVTDSGVEMADIASGSIISPVSIKYTKSIVRKMKQ